MHILLKTTDSWDILPYTIKSASGTPVDLTNATVSFIMAKTGSLSPVINKEADIIDAENGKVQYKFTETDTLLTGTFNAEFQVVFPNEERKTFPTAGYLKVQIASNLDGSLAGSIEEQIVIQVSEIEQFKEDIDARATAVEQAIIGVDLATDNANSAADRANTAADNAEGMITDLQGIDAVQFHERQNEFDAQLAQTEQQFKSEATEEEATLGNELVDGTGWVLGTGWSGDFASGFTHTLGNTATLTKPLTGLGSKFYQVEISVSSPSSTMASNSGWTVSIGGSTGFEMYEGNYMDHTYIRGIQALGGSDLIITPQTGFDGTITNVSVKEITGMVLPTTQVKDSNDVNSFEVKPTKAANENVFIGKNNALYNTKGKQSVGVGVNALSNNTTGFWNVAVGKDALEGNTVGSRNVALGYIALKKNISGHRNIAIGPFNMHDNTHGHNNISMGADTMQRNTTGHNNVAIGLNNLANNLTGSHNIAIGSNALSQNKVDGNIGIGKDAGTLGTTATETLAIGFTALKYNTVGGRNLVIGHNSLNNTGATDVVRNLIVGSSSGQSMVSGANYNVIIGHNNGSTITTGNNNVLIGYNVTTNSPTDSYQMNIANFLYGRTSSSTQRLGIGVSTPLASLHLPAGKTSQFGAPLRFSLGAILSSPEKGALEYDGTDLYLTNEAGIRKKLAFV